MKFDRRGFSSRVCVLFEILEIFGGFWVSSDLWQANLRSSDVDSVMGFNVWRVAG